MNIHTQPPINSISDIVTRSDELSRIYDHIEKLNGLQAKLSEYLDFPLKEHVVVADYQQQTLVLHADSAAWTTRLRYRTRELLTAFKTTLPELRTIHIKNRPPAPSNHTVREPTRVSPETANAIRQMATAITHPPLRAVLLRLTDQLGIAN